MNYYLLKHVIRRQSNNFSENERMFRDSLLFLYNLKRRQRGKYLNGWHISCHRLLLFKIIDARVIVKRVHRLLQVLTYRLVDSTSNRSRLFHRNVG